jgi:hypothetical protein
MGEEKSIPKGKWFSFLKSHLIARQVYKGEFSAGARHGFGITFLTEGHRFMGLKQPLCLMIDSQQGDLIAE